MKETKKKKKKKKTKKKTTKKQIRIQIGDKSRNQLALQQEETERETNQSARKASPL